MANEFLQNIQLDETLYVDLLTKLIGESERLQNNPHMGMLAQEDLAAQHVMDLLKPLSQEEGGPLKIEHLTYVEGRGNLIITYPGSTDKTCGFVGSHLDVVPATPETWDFPPFELTRDGDKLRGRGTTDSLGHVAVVTAFMHALAIQKPDLKVSVVAVFIASEEAESVPPNAGVESLVEQGKLEHLKQGPIFWIDCSDSQPCIGTAGAIQWHLKATGKLFHSGLPHKGINALELGMEATKIIQDKFYRDFPPHPEETRYNFATPSTMKPTQMECAKGSLNQLPPHATISGDIRLTPFYEVKDVLVKVQEYVDELNAGMADPSIVGTRGPCSKYVLPDEGLTGTLELTFGAHCLSGIACSLDSPGYHAICDATAEIKGKAEPYAICGSLPLVKEMQEAGFDLQLTGYGVSDVYHANNEYCNLSDMADAIKIFGRIVSKLDDAA